MVGFVKEIFILKISKFLFLRLKLCVDLQSSTPCSSTTWRKVSRGSWILKTWIMKQSRTCWGENTRWLMLLYNPQSPGTFMLARLRISTPSLPDYLRQPISINYRSWKKSARFDQIFSEIEIFSCDLLQETLCDNLTVASCLECLVLADLHNAEELKNTSVRYVVDHSEDFVDQVGFTRNNFLFRTQSF